MKMAHYPPVKPVPCPVCGRRPKEIWDINPGGGFAKLRCKPWFRKAHLEVECGAANPDYAYWKAVKVWNAIAQEITNGMVYNPNGVWRRWKGCGSGGEVGGFGKNDGTGTWNRSLANS